MRVIFAVLVLFVVSYARADEPIGQPAPAGKLISETWQSAYLDGQRAGYVQVTVHEFGSGEQRVLRAVQKQHLTVRRFGDVAHLDNLIGSDETPDGRVLRVFMRQGLSKGVELTVTGEVEGDKLHVVATGKMKFDKTIPWNPKVVGFYGEQQLVAKLKPQPGTTFDYLFFEPIINAIIKVQAKAEGMEQIKITGYDKVRHYCVSLRLRRRWPGS